jgi:hypothetical protein
MFYDQTDHRPLESCCVESRRARIPALIGPRWAADSLFPYMLHAQIERHAPTRLIELTKTLFGAMYAENPFWGIYEKIECANPRCRRTLHILLIDAQMITVVDQLVRQLYDLVDESVTADLTFKEPTQAQRTRAKEIISGLVFHTGRPPLIRVTPPPGQMPHFYLAEAMTIAFAFMIVHETSHQGPQTMGPDFFIPLLPAAFAGAAREGISLDRAQAGIWAQEMAADTNAMLIMATDAVKNGLAGDLRQAWYRSFIAGITLALKAWELIIAEISSQNRLIHRKLLQTHPPARWRIVHLTDLSANAQHLGIIEGDNSWTERILTALENLHSP